MSGSGLLEGKVAVITGAASGQGRAAARRVASEGAAVLVGDGNEQGAAETVSMIDDAGGSRRPIYRLHDWIDGGAP